MIQTTRRDGHGILGVNESSNIAALSPGDKAARLASSITSTELIELAISLSIDVHPRTAGILKRGISRIVGGSTMTMIALPNGRFVSTQGAWELYYECLYRLENGVVLSE